VELRSEKREFQIRNRKGEGGGREKVKVNLRDKTTVGKPSNAAILVSFRKRKRGEENLEEERKPPHPTIGLEETSSHGEKRK